jgi:hypothetical protein
MAFPEPKSIGYRYGIRIAASITIALGFAMGYFYYQHAVFDKIAPAQVAMIRPVQENVQLTFEDGAVVILNNQGKATQAIEGVQEIKTENLSIMTTQITSFKIRFQHLGTTI